MSCRTTFSAELQQNCDRPMVWLNSREWRG